jgi:hypothetical protein
MLNGNRNRVSEAGKYKDIGSTQSSFLEQRLESQTIEGDEIGNDDFDFEALLKEGEAALNQFPYDIASAHYESEDFPEDLPPDAAFRHLGMYFGWAVDRELISDKVKKEFSDTIAKFKKRQLKPSDLFKSCCGEELTKEHFNDTGNAFTKTYYRPGWKHSYTHDYDILTGWPDERKFFYFEDNWENYESVKAMIEKRYKEWLEEKS